MKRAEILHIAAAFAVVMGATAAQAGVGAVFTATNDPNGNEVVMYDRARNGSLSNPTYNATGGVGSGPGAFFPGDALASQGSIRVTQDGRHLVVTNFRDDVQSPGQGNRGSVSVFAISRNGLTRTDEESSRGDFAVGSATFGSLVYVLNAGGNGLINDGCATEVGTPTAYDCFQASITGYRLARNGHLSHIPGSTRTTRISQGSSSAARPSTAPAPPRTPSVTEPP